MSGSVKWPVTAWRRLLELGLGVLDGAGVPIQWTFGGGTALALKVGHRVSYDVDLFLEDASALRLLSPNRNAVARSLTDRWQEPGNYIKLELEEGSVDFILAGRQTALMPWLYPFMDRKVHVEQPAEIIAKKLKYRGSRLLSRDLFDLLAVHRWDPIQLSAAVRAVPEAARRAADRVKRFAPRYRDTIREEVNPTAAGVDLLDADPLEAVKILTGA